MYSRKMDRADDTGKVGGCCSIGKGNLHEAKLIGKSPFLGKQKGVYQKKIDTLQTVEKPWAPGQEFCCAKPSLRDGSVFFAVPPQTRLLFEKSKTKNFCLNRMFMRFLKGQGCNGKEVPSVQRTALRSKVLTKTLVGV